MELVRRAVLVVGVVLALWTAIVPLPERIALGPQDFRADQARRPAWSGDREIPPEAFVRRRTEGRTVDASGPAWTAVADAVDALSAGSPAAGEGPGPVGVRHGATAYYVAPRAPFLGDVGTRLGKETPLLYVRIEGAEGPRWLTATWRPGSEGGEVEPASIFHPRRRTWPWVLLAAVALYLLLPRPKRGADTLRSHPRAAVVMPDVLGTLLFAVFFGLSLVIASQMATTGQPLAADWRVPTLILWAMSLFGLGILAVAAHYATLRFRLLPDRLERVALTGTTSCPYEAIEAVEVGAQAPPKALGWLGWIVGLFNWRAYGPTLLAMSRDTQVLSVRCRDGTTMRISLSALEEPERLVAALQPYAREPQIAQP